MAVTSKPLNTTRAPARAGTLLVWLMQASLYVLALFALSLAVSHGLSWAQRSLDDLRYGVPRTVQLAGVVGDGDSAVNPTHFIALNIEGQVSVLVLPGGDVSRLTTLPGPYVIGDDGGGGGAAARARRPDGRRRTRSARHYPWRNSCLC